MKKVSKLLVSAVVFLASVAALSGCSSDDNNDDNGKNTAKSLKTGDPCTEAQKDSCYGGLCLTDNTFQQLTENHNAAEIPNGYCSKLACSPKNTPEGECGPGAYCYDLAQFVDSPLTACFKVCETDNDCRKDEGYLCTDFSGTQYEPLKKKACLPPSLLCLLDVPTSQCPDVGPKDAGTSDSATDGGSQEDAGSEDAAPEDAGNQDAAAQDAGSQDAAAQDAGPADAASE